MTTTDTPTGGHHTAHLDDLVAAWHDGAGGDMELHEWLGLSAGEYAALGRGDHTLPLRWQLFPPAPQHGWLTDSDELSPHRWDEIIAGLWVGGYEIGRHGPDLDRFDLIVSADSSSSQLDVATSAETCCFFDDAGVPDEPLVAPAISRAAAAWRAGATVLVRCAYGQNRSAYLAARILVELDWPVAHAVHQLRARRGQSVLENPSFVAALRGLPDTSAAG